MQIDTVAAMWFASFIIVMLVAGKKCNNLCQRFETDVI